MSRRISVFNTDAVVPGQGSCLGFVHMGCSDMNRCIQTYCKYTGEVEVS